MDKNLKKLSRIELLQLLLKVTETNEALIAENDELRHTPVTQEAPKVKIPQAAKVGSIAEAALQANGYFEAAQNAADDYLREIKQLRDELMARANANAQQIRATANSAGAAAPNITGGLAGSPLLDGLFFLGWFSFIVFCLCYGHGKHEPWTKMLTHSIRRHPLAIPFAIVVSFCWQCIQYIFAPI